jgi:SAM-dependent methyltransferase
MENNRKLYDELADDFSRTRSSVWEEFKSLKEYFQDSDRILDLGCGNGRFYELFADKQDVQYFGADNSQKLLNLARQKYPSAQFVPTDGLNLPFANNFFDKILSIAVLHHLPGSQMRREFLLEAGRVLKPGGILVLTTWKLWPNFKHLPTYLNYLMQKVLGQSELDWGDLYIAWGKKGYRYFHNFSTGELKKLLQGAGFVVQDIGILKRKSGEESMVVVAKKEKETLQNISHGIYS